eukprot:247203-Amphidinium_carterae.1
MILLGFLIYNRSILAAANDLRLDVLCKVSSRNPSLQEARSSEPKDVHDFLSCFCWLLQCVAQVTKGFMEREMRYAQVTLLDPFVLSTGQNPKRIGECRNAGNIHWNHWRNRCTTPTVSQGTWAEGMRTRPEKEFPVLQNQPAQTSSWAQTHQRRQKRHKIGLFH